MKISVDDNLKYFYFYQKICIDISCKWFPKGHNLHEMSKLIFLCGPELDRQLFFFKYFSTMSEAAQHWAVVQHSVESLSIMSSHSALSGVMQHYEWSHAVLGVESCSIMWHLSALWVESCSISGVMRHYEWSHSALWVESYSIMSGHAALWVVKCSIMRGVIQHYEW